MSNASGRSAASCDIACDVAWEPGSAFRDGLSRRTAIAAVAAIAVGLAAEPASAQELRTIRVGLPSDTLGPAAIRIVEEMGFLASRGLKAEFSMLGSGNGAVTGLIAGAVDLVHAGPTELVAAQARGQKVVAIANSYAGYVASVILAKSVADKTGVSPAAPLAQRLKVLDGLLLASPSATSSVTSVYAGAAKDAGANPRFTFMNMSQMPAALASGAIQGYGAAAPIWVSSVLSGDGVMWIDGPKGELPPGRVSAASGQLQVMRHFAEANPDVVKKITAALADLSKAIDERPAEVKAAVARIFSKMDSSSLDLVYPAEAKAWKGKPLDVEDIRLEIRLMKEAGAPLPNVDGIDLASMLYR